MARYTSIGDGTTTKHALVSCLLSSGNLVLLSRTSAVGSGQRSRSPSLTKRIALSGNEIDSGTAGDSLAYYDNSWRAFTTKHT